MAASAGWLATYRQLTADPLVTFYLLPACLLGAVEVLCGAVDHDKRVEDVVAGRLVVSSESGEY